MNPDRRYCIIKVEDIEYIDFSKICQSSPDTMRLSNDGTKTFVKYDGEQPECLFNIAGDLVGLEEYTRDEFRKILEGPEWVPQD